MLSNVIIPLANMNGVQVNLSLLEDDPLLRERRKKKIPTMFN